MLAFTLLSDSMAVGKRVAAIPGRRVPDIQRGVGGVATVPASLIGLLWLLAAPMADAAEGDMDPAATETWQLPDAHLHGIAALGSDAWAVGYWGTILRSADRGETWERVPTPTDATLYAVSFADSRHGWAVGASGTLLRSEDGGRTWERVRVEISDELGDPIPLDSPLFGVAATSATEAWAVGDFGGVLHTRNGRQWRQVVIPAEDLADENIPERIFNAVRFTDPMRGAITGEFGTLLRTADGGETWTGERQLAGAIEDIYLFDVAPASGGIALSTGVGGVTLRSADAGSQWAAIDSGTTAGLFGVAIRNGRALLVGDRGVMRVSDDGGVTWRKPERPPFFNWLQGVTFADDELAYAVGEHGVVVRSLDGGERWEWKHGRQPRPEAGVSVPDPGARVKPETGPAPVPAPTEP
jgi:photosystem II stability/assembly factor-like uncharacterized protein